MSENGGVEENRAGNSSGNVEEEVPEIQTLTQEAVNEQFKGLIAPLTCQLKKLTQLVQGMVTTPRPSHFPRADYSTISGIVITSARHTLFKAFMVSEIFKSLEMLCITHSLNKSNGVFKL